MKIGYLQATVKALSDDASPNGEFEVILSTSALDREGETVQAGAFLPLPASIPIYYNHSWRTGALPVARAEPYYDGDVLKGKGYFASTAPAQEMRTLVNEGVIDSMSVGYLPSKTKSLGKGQTAIMTADLIEASFTAIPVNVTATILASKSIDDDGDSLAALVGVKAGARNNSTDASRLQQIHDLAVENGASCSGVKSVGSKPRTKAVAGSFEDRREDIQEALAEFAAGALALAYPNENPDDRAWRLNIVATFDDRVVYRIGWDDDDALQVTYSWDGEEVTITGQPEAVTVDQVISPAPAGDQENSSTAPATAAAPAAKAVGAAAGAGVDGEAATDAALAALASTYSALVASLG